MDERAARAIDAALGIERRRLVLHPPVEDRLELRALGAEVRLQLAQANTVRVRLEVREDLVFRRAADAGEPADAAGEAAESGRERDRLLRGARCGGERREPDRFRVAEVRVDGRDDDARFDGEDLDADDRDAHPGVDHDPLLEDHVEHFGEAG